MTERATHERLLHDPDGYRPSSCARCGEHVLHVHDYRERKFRAEPGIPVIIIIRHICVHCAAIWQTLPAFVARHLWRTWRVVERAMTGCAPSSSEIPVRDWPLVPARTRQRWSERLRAAAWFLIQVLAVSGGPVWSTLAGTIPPHATRAELIDVYAEKVSAPAGERFASLSALVYRLSPKVRLM